MQSNLLAKRVELGVLALITTIVTIIIQLQQLGAHVSQFLPALQQAQSARLFFEFSFSRLHVCSSKRERGKRGETSEEGSEGKEASEVIISFAEMQLLVVAPRAVLSSFHYHVLAPTRTLFPLPSLSLSLARFCSLARSVSFSLPCPRCVHIHSPFLFVKSKHFSLPGC